MPKFIFTIEETRRTTISVEADDWEQAYNSLHNEIDREDERFILTPNDITEHEIIDETDYWTDEDTGEIEVLFVDQYRAENGKLIEITEQNDSKKVQGD